jgi:transcriptional regulator with XRE-family HTH domain
VRAKTVRDLGAMVRAARHTQNMTQADLAARLSVGRDWVVRLEQGQPRLEAQRVLDALTVLGLSLDVQQTDARETDHTNTRLEQFEHR